MWIRTDAPAHDPDASSSALISAVRYLLRPLVKVLLARSISYPFFSSLLKEIYVEVAIEEFTLQGKPQTDSRISLLTGVHRKDVKRLRTERPVEAAPPPPAASLSARLMKLWASDPKRLDETGRHKPLPQMMREGGAESFEALVSSVSKDIRSRVILDEWLRTGVAFIDEQGKVGLNTDAFLKSRAFDEKSHDFGQNTHDHLSAAAYNLLESEPRFPERSVQFGRLTQESVAELSELSKRLGAQALETLSSRAADLEARDREKPDALQRINFGFYYFSDAQKKGPQRP